MASMSPRGQWVKQWRLAGCPKMTSWSVPRGHPKPSDATQSKHWQLVSCKSSTDGAGNHNDFSHKVITVRSLLQKKFSMPLVLYMKSHQYTKSHCGYKTILGLSYFYNIQWLLFYYILTLHQVAKNLLEDWGPADKIDRYLIFKMIINDLTKSVVGYKVNSSDARNGIFWLIWSIPCLLMPWLLKSPGHQQEWYWQYRTGNM